MKQIPWRKLYYHLKHRYFTLNNAVLVAAFVIALGWAWGSISMMQRNYTLQRKVDTKERQATLMQLEVQTLEYEQRYFKSTEYQELAAREGLGLASPGEKVLVLPPNSQAAKRYDVTAEEQTAAKKPQVQPTNIEQWLTFLLGGNARGLQE